MRATRWCGWRCSAARPWCYHAYAYCDGDSNPDRFANADTNWNSDADPDEHTDEYADAYCNAD
jgi:hypothetical protein